MVIGNQVYKKVRLYEGESIEIIDSRKGLYSFQGLEFLDLGDRVILFVGLRKINDKIKNICRKQKSIK